MAISLLAPLLLVPPALAEKRIEVQWQELRVEDQSPGKAGVRIEGSVRDLCSLYIQNPYWFEGHTELDRPCGDWRPLELEEPERRLVLEPIELLLKQRGPVVSGELHRLEARVQTPTALQGSEIQLVHQDGSFLLRSQDLGMALVLADFRGVELPFLSLSLDGQLLVEGSEPVELRWQVAGRDVPVDVGELRIDGAVLEAVGQDWRCQALQAVEPSDYAELGNPQALAGYAAKTCPEAALVQGPPLCRQAAGQIQDLDSALRLKQELQPVAEHCGKEWAEPAAAWAEEQLALHLKRGDLDQALAIVEAFPEELGAARVQTLDQELRARVQAEIPTRFEWALQNGADEQARQLLESYGPLLGEDWSAQAERRLR